jgi:predicted O-methyltransferase YrrM
MRSLTLLALLLLESSCNSHRSAPRVGPPVTPARLDTILKTIVSRVQRRYREFGVTIAPAPWKITDAGSAAKQLVDARTGRLLQTGLGFHETDIELFLKIAQRHPARSIFIVGNAFGYSTFVLSEIFKDAIVDAIDAEVEGDDSKKGSELTRLIARRYYPTVRLTIGFSPQDVPKAVHPRLMQDFHGYDLVFVDGLHTDEQQLKDFRAMVPYLARRTIIVFHDVGMLNMRESLKAIWMEARGLGFDTFVETAESTIFGLGVVSRGVDSLGRDIAGLPPVVERYIQEGRKIHMSRLNEWFWSWDKDRNGRISRREYLGSDAAIMAQRGRVFDRILQLADGNHDRELALVECREAFGWRVPRRDLARVIQPFDLNRDGIITQDELSRSGGPFRKAIEREIEFLYRLGDIGEDRQLPLETFLKVFGQQP